MKNIGYLAIVVSFLYGSYLTSLDKETVDWLLFGIALALGIVGVFLVQLAEKQHAQDSENVSSNLTIIESSLNNIVEKVGQLSAQKHEIFTYDMSQKIDDMLIEDLNNFADSRKTISHAYGLEAFAEVMNHFAGGERYLNRVWSASADGYIDEVNAYIEKAHEQFLKKKKKLDGFAQRS